MRAIILSCCIVLAASASDAQNVYFNSSMESGGVGAPDFWLANGAGSPLVNLVYRQNPGDAVEGTDYLRVQANATLNTSDYHGSWGQNPQIASQPNCRYRLSYKYRRSSNQILRGRMDIHCDGASCYIDRYSPDFFSPGSVGVWAQSTETFDTWPISGNATVYHFGVMENSAIPGFAVAGDYVDYDDIKLELLETYTTAVFTLNSIGTYDFANTAYRVNFTALGATGTTTGVELKTSAPPGITRSALAKYWILTAPNTSFTAQPVFSYTNAELLASGIAEAQLRLMRSTNSGPWTEVSSTVNAGANTVTTASSVTTFSSWAIAGPPASAADNWQHFQ